MYPRFFHVSLLAALWMLPIVPTPRNEAAMAQVQNLAAPQPRTGKDHAIFFVNEIYPKGWPKLNFPKSDAAKIAAELHDNYGFANPTIYENKSRAEILNILSEWQRRDWQVDEQLLVFFSGHGYYDSFCTGFYVPQDGELSDPGGASYLDWSSIQSRLAGSNCRHILLVADACFAGTADLKKTCPHLFDGDKGAREPVQPNRPAGRDLLIQSTLRDQARLYFAAAGNTTTNDRSEFARLFLDALQHDYDRNLILDMSTLRKRLRLAQPTPQFSTFSGNQDDEAFLFVRNTPSKDRDGDGVPDATDQCPDRFGTASNKGCPEEGGPGSPIDSDGDGITDEKDSCPNQYGTAKANGCPDRDDDGVPDISDQCPDQPGKLNWLGCPDTDGDGLHDGEDRCPNQPGARADRGCPPPDSDGDGVPDKSDKCPTQPGKAYLEGCPDPRSESMVRIAGGTFSMGCTSEQQDCDGDEKPVRSVTVSSFWLAKTELTFEEYDAFCEATKREKPDDRGWGRGKRPVINVSWDDAVAYCNWRSQQEGLTPCYTVSGGATTCNWRANGYRLPTEAEWEYAARGGGKAVLFGNGKNTINPAEINFDASADYKKPYSVVGEYRGKTVPAGSLNSPNALGLHDMSGNVREWCWDWYGTYPSASQTDPKGPDTGSGRVNRGGSWAHSPQFCRVADRFSNSPGYRNYFLGFRLSRTD